MKNLDKAISSLKLEELRTAGPNGPKSNLIEPTEAEIGLIVAALKDGKQYKEIKKEIRRDSNGAKLGFSFGQIREIEIAMRDRVRELTKPEEPVVV